MNTLREWLAIADLTTDGQANEVADLVSGELALLPELIEALEDPADRLRGHAADALEKVARRHPDPVLAHLPVLLRVARQDPVPMVRWHLAMALGHLAISPKHTGEIVETLLGLLDDSSVFVQSWAIASLCIHARLRPEHAERVIRAVGSLARSPSTAIRTRTRKALAILSDSGTPFPKGWIKSQRFKFGNVEDGEGT